MGNYFYNTTSNKDSKDEYTITTPQMDVRSQMRHIIEYWIRTNMSINTCGTIMSIDIMNLIIDNFTYQIIFEEENNEKLNETAHYKKRLKSYQSQSNTTTNLSTNPKTEYDFLFKLLLVGDSSVGKTSLLRRYANEYYTASYYGRHSSIGVDFQIKTIHIDRKIVKLQIWDSRGEQRFRTITSSYYRGAHGVIMVYDIGNTQTFENLTEWNFQTDRFASRNACRMIVGNKTDLKERYVNNGDEIVSNEYAQNFAKTLNIEGSIQTSAKNGDNVDKAFECIAKQIMCRYINLNQRLKFPFYG
eukprot:161675_1